MTVANQAKKLDAQKVAKLAQKAAKKPTVKTRVRAGITGHEITHGRR